MAVLHMSFPQIASRKSRAALVAWETWRIPAPMMCVYMALEILLTSKPLLACDALERTRKTFIHHEKEENIVLDC